MSSVAGTKFMMISTLSLVVPHLIMNLPPLKLASTAISKLLKYDRGLFYMDKTFYWTFCLVAWVGSFVGLTVLSTQSPVPIDIVVREVLPFFIALWGFIIVSAIIVLLSSDIFPDVDSIEDLKLRIEDYIDDIPAGPFWEFDDVIKTLEKPPVKRKSAASQFKGGNASSFGKSSAFKMPFGKSSAFKSPFGSSSSKTKSQEKNFANQWSRNASVGKSALGAMKGFR